MRILTAVGFLRSYYMYLEVCEKMSSIAKKVFVREFSKLQLTLECLPL